MSVSARGLAALLLVFVAHVFVLACGATNEPGWLLNQESVIYGKYTSRFSASGIRNDYKQGHTLVITGPDWKPVCYNGASKIYYTASVTQYIVQMTHALMVSGVNDLDSHQWTGRQSCVLNGKPALKYHYLAKKPDARLKQAECWFSPESTIPRAASEMQAGVNRVPFEPHALLQVVYHKSVGDEGDVVLSTTLCKKVEILPGTYTYPKGYRSVSDPMQVVMSDIGKDVMNDIIESPIHH